MKHPLSVRLVTGAILVIITIVSRGVTESGFAQKKERPASAVELTCKIVGMPEDHPRSVWLIELCNAAGAPLRRALRMVGDTVHFKNLLPGIYRIYLSGKGGRRSVESIDLRPGADPQNMQFAKEVKVPRAAAQITGLHQVNVRALAVPKEARQHMQQSEKDQLDGNEAAMVKHLKEAIKIYPDYADAWNNLGAYYHRAGDYEQSIRSFTKVTELDPDFHVGWMNLGGSLLAIGRYQEALEANKKALKLGPDDAIANAQLGLSHYYLHDYAQARERFKRVLALDPAFPDAPQLFLAQIALGEGAFAEAMEYLHGYLELHPNAPDAAQARRTLAALSNGMIVALDVIRK
jgi:tetratricopeptide (TPR) repeat protein